MRPSKSSTLITIETDSWLCNTCRNRNGLTRQCQNCDSFKLTIEQKNENIPITINMPNGKCIIRSTYINLLLFIFNYFMYYNIYIRLG